MRMHGAVSFCVCAHSQQKKTKALAALPMLNKSSLPLMKTYKYLQSQYPLWLNFVLGGLMVLALPPLGMWWLVWLSMPLFFISLDNYRDAHPVKIFWRAWAFHFGFFLFGLYWMGHAFLVEADGFLWLMPFAVVLLPAGLAIFYGLASLMWLFAIRRHASPPLARLFLFIAMMVLADYVRGHVLTGLPWNLTGMIALSWLPIAQSAAIWGVYGLGIVIWVVGLLPVIFRHHKAVAGVLVLGLVGLAATGYLRLQAGEAEDKAEAPVVRIVQPHIVQTDKWDPALRRAHIEKIVTLSAQLSGQKPDIIIWPETAMPVLLDREESVRQFIDTRLPQDVPVITGSVRRDVAEVSGRVHSYNSLFVIQNGDVIASYDKHHLVPFGEYLPFQSLLEAMGLRQLTQLRGGFTPGPGAVVLKPGWMPSFMPLICYEVIFPATDLDHTRPKWLVNVTNDAWFGRSAGPWQHFAMARMRSIEMGLPMARAANTGVSAMISAKGVVLDFLALGEAGVLDVVLPPPMERTIYARFSDFLFFILIGMLTAPLFVFKAPERDVDCL